MTSAEEPTSDLVAIIGRWLGPAVCLIVLFLPTPAGLNPAGQRLAAVVILMAIWWVTQALPIAVTSLVPLALFPALGIQPAKVVGQSYLGDSSFLYLGGFIIALGIERWGLHRRIALLTVTAVGTSPRRIVLGFLLATFGLSMWISNTATTLLMLPIAMALLATLGGLHTTALTAGTGEESPQHDAAFQHFALALTLGIGYAASIGGLATLVGTPTNIAFVNIWVREFPDAPVLSAGQWMVMWTPFGFVFLLFTWLLLTFGMRIPAGFRGLDRSFFRNRVRDLGTMGTGEWIMLLLFVLTALLWIFRTDFRLGEPVLIYGWNRVAAGWLRAWGVPAKVALEYISDATVGMSVALLMFVIPVDRSPQGKVRFLMDWETAAQLPWEILLLFGGGFAIAGAFEDTKLSVWVGEVFSEIAKGQPVWVLLVAVCLLLTFLTEFTSNVATVNALLPIIAAASVALNLDPRLLMIPATVSASCAFMLPIGTPPNAIVFGAGRIRMSQMAGYGLILNLVGVVLATVTAQWWMVPQLGIRLP
ncbi:MAG: SLC13/DASS family transporter [Planctomycetes bacterium]|nr:SLC13/DASS family transporter [Planctomycetota bacterium]